MAFKENIKNAFAGIYAGDALKQSTMLYLKEQIKMRSGKRTSFVALKAVVVSACVFILLFTGIYSFGVYATPEIYVDVDINPSVELVVNRFDKIIGVYAYNREGEKVLSELNLQNMSYRNALTELMNAAEQNGFIQDGGLVAVTLRTNIENRENEILGEIQNRVENALSEKYSETLIEVFSVSEEIKKCSHDLNLSPAKYLAVTELMEADSTVTIEGCMGHSIDSIRQMTGEKSGHRHGHHGN